MTRPLLLLALLAATAHAQPAPDALVGAWRSRQAAAVRSVVRVEADETLSRRLDGPRGTVRIETRGTVALAPEPRRTVTSAQVDGRDVGPERLDALEARLGRAFGHGFHDASRMSALVPRALARGTARGVTAGDIDGRPAWRVSLTFEPHAGQRRSARGGPPGRRSRGEGPAGPDRAEAWFTRSADAPRLLRLDTSGRRPGGGVLRRQVDFTPVGALDVPDVATAELRVTQRRRLRGYTTSIAAEARYSGVSVVRR